MDMEYIFVGMFQGLIDEVEVYKDEKDAEMAWSGYTDIEYSEFEEDNSILEQTNYEGTTIYVTELLGKVGCA